MAENAQLPPHEAVIWLDHRRAARYFPVEVKNNVEVRSITLFAEATKIMKLVEKKGLFRPTFCGIFVIGNFLGIVALITCLLGHADILANRTIFGVQLFPDGIPTTQSSVVSGLLAFVGIALGSGVYGIGTWLVILAGLTILNSLASLRRRN